MQVLNEELARPRELLRPCLLLLLAESRGHGYDLMARLKPFGFDWGGPGPIYRELRVLEAADLVRSNWEAPGAGPARHVYELTSCGAATLAKWAESLDALAEVLDAYRARYVAATGAEGAEGSPPEPEAEADASSTPAKTPAGRMRFRRR